MVDKSNSNPNRKKTGDYNAPWYIIVYKFLFGLFEFTLGLGIILFGKQGLELYRTYTHQELLEDPHDLLVRLTEGIVPGILTHRTFLAVYLLVLGGAKIAGATGLVYHKNWGVDLLVGLTFIMLPFQLVQFAKHPSLPDIIYISLGLLIAFYLINFNLSLWVKNLKNSFLKKNK